MLAYTKDEMKRLHKERLEELIDFAGDKQHLSKMMGKAIATVNAWVRRGEIHKFHACEVEKHPLLGQKFTAEYLRVDLFVYPMSDIVKDFKKAKETEQSTKAE